MKVYKLLLDKSLGCDSAYVALPLLASLAAARQGLPWGTLALIIVAAVVKGAGEMAGSLLGAPERARTGMNEIEVHKVRFAGRHPA